MNVTPPRSPWFHQHGTQPSDAQTKLELCRHHFVQTAARVPVVSPSGSGNYNGDC